MTKLNLIYFEKTFSNLISENLIVTSALFRDDKGTLTQRYKTNRISFFNLKTYLMCKTNY